MKTLKLMDSTGDSPITFDETDLSDTKATDEARALFERMTGKGAAVFAVNRGGLPDKRVKDFGELEQENVIVPAIVSG